MNENNKISNNLINNNQNINNLIKITSSLTNSTSSSISNSISPRELKFIIHQIFNSKNENNNNKDINNKDNNLISVSKMRSNIEKKLQIPKYSLINRKNEIEGFMLEYQTLNEREKERDLIKEIEMVEDEDGNLIKKVYKAGRWSKNEKETLIRVVREYAVENNYELADIFPELRSEDYPKKRTRHKELWNMLTEIIPDRNKNVFSYFILLIFKTLLLFYHYNYY